LYISRLLSIRRTLSLLFCDIICISMEGGNMVLNCGFESDLLA
jgi:hypothetical protein